MTASEPTTDQAIAAVRTGEIEAYAPLVRRYHAPLTAYLRARAPDAATADDLAQSAFVAAFEQLDRFEAGADFGAWLFGIARNLARQAWRTLDRDRRHRTVIERALREPLLAEPPDADRTESRLAALRACVDGLPEHWADLVARHYHEGLSLAALAAERASAPSTIRVTLHRVRARLRRCIEARLAGQEMPR